VISRQRRVSPITSGRGEGLLSGGVSFFNNW
jgi:hypothetical protein